MRAEGLRALRRLWAAFVVLVAALAVPAAAHADGGVGFRVDGEPGSVLDAGFIRLQIAPGGSASGHFDATNTSKQNAQLTVYGADGLTGDTTGIVYSDKGDPITDAGTWIAPSVGGMLLPSNGARRIDFSVRVPAGARPGDHVGGVVLEQRRSGGTISQVVRNVVPILIDVSGAAGVSIDLRSANVTALPGTSLPAVTVKMINNGRRICRPVLTVALTGPSENGTPVSRQLDAILPGDTVPFPMPWPRMLAKGNYQASVTASGCGATETLRTNVRSALIGEAPPPATTGTGADPNVVTTAPPGPGKFTAPDKSPDRSGEDGERDSGSAPPASLGGNGTSGGNPVGAAGTGSASAGGGKSGMGGVSGALGDIGNVAIKYLPPLLERLAAPLSLLGLMLLFLFAQETFDRKDPKLALAPIQRDADLEFLPLGEGDPGAGPVPAGDLELVRSPSPASPAPS